MEFTQGLPVVNPLIEVTPTGGEDNKLNEELESHSINHQPKEHCSKFNTCGAFSMIKNDLYQNITISSDLCEIPQLHTIKHLEIDKTVQVKDEQIDHSDFENDYRTPLNDQCDGTANLTVLQQSNNNQYDVYDSYQVNKAQIQNVLSDTEINLCISNILPDIKDDFSEDNQVSNYGFNENIKIFHDSINGGCHEVENKKKHFSCAECGRSFSRRSALRKAQEETDNNGEHLLICNNCHILKSSWSFAKEQQKSESRKNSQRKAYQCDECRKWCKSMMGLIQHKVTHVKDYIITCSVCQKGFSNKKSFKKHMLSHVVDKSHICSVCKESFVSKYELTCHLRVHGNHEDEKQCKCDVCDKMFDRPSKLKAHILTHNENRCYECKKCGKSFKHKSNLNIHDRLHTGKNLFTCNTCKKPFTKLGHYKSHIQCVHSDNRPFQCEICNKSFKSKRCLKVHFTIHSGEKPFKCKLCEKTYRLRGFLTTHMRDKHNQMAKIRHVCHWCQISFSKSSGLKLHERLVHTGEKPYKCRLCSQFFASCSRRAAHMREHAVDKPQCDRCGKILSSAAHLKGHIKRHLGEKPYPCQICEKAFVGSEDLKQHILTHTKEEKYQCSDCGKCFRYRRQWRNHVRNHHTDN